jgi:hypothetical protein
LTASATRFTQSSANSGAVGTSACSRRYHSPSAHVEPAGQQFGPGDAAALTLDHGVADVQESLAGLLFGAGRGLMAEDDMADRDGFALGEFLHFRGGGPRGAGARRDVGVRGCDCHAVGVQMEHLARAQHHVVLA